MNFNIDLKEATTQKQGNKTAIPPTFDYFSYKDSQTKNI